MEDEMSLTSWLKVNMGLRNTVYSADGNAWNSLEPRLALKVQLAPDVNVKTSYAEMSQFSHQVATTYLDLPTNCWLPSGQLVAPMRSRQVAAGIYSKFPHDLHLNVEGWFKTMDNLVEYNGMNSMFVRLDEWEESFKVGKGRSYGLEVDGGYETPALSLNAFYTLSWNERFFEDFWRRTLLGANWRVGNSGVLEDFKDTVVRKGVAALGLPKDEVAAYGVTVNVSGKPENFLDAYVLQGVLHKGRIIVFSAKDTKKR